MRLRNRVGNSHGISPNSSGYPTDHHLHHHYDQNLEKLTTRTITLADFTGVMKGDEEQKRGTSQNLSEHLPMQHTSATPDMPFGKKFSPKAVASVPQRYGQQDLWRECGTAVAERCNVWLMSLFEASRIKGDTALRPEAYRCRKNLRQSAIICSCTAKKLAVGSKPIRCTFARDTLR